MDPFGEYTGATRADLDVICSDVPFRAVSTKQVWVTLGRGNPPRFEAPAIPRRPAAHLRNLVLVACHAVFIGSDYSKAEDPDAWLLLDYQKVLRLPPVTQVRPLKLLRRFKSNYTCITIGIFCTL